MTYNTKLSSFMNILSHLTWYRYGVLFSLFIMLTHCLALHFHVLFVIKIMYRSVKTFMLFMQRKNPKILRLIKFQGLSEAYVWLGVFEFTFIMFFKCKIKLPLQVLIMYNYSSVAISRFAKRCLLHPWTFLFVRLK